MRIEIDSINVTAGGNGHIMVMTKDNTAYWITENTLTELNGQRVELRNICEKLRELGFGRMSGEAELCRMREPAHPAHGLVLRRLELTHTPVEDVIKET